MGIRRPESPPPLERGWRRHLGPPNSWRRIALTGVAGGVALAIIASVVGTAIGGGGVHFGSVDKKHQTPLPVVDTTSDVADSAPIDAPVEEAPTEEPVEVPTDTPVEEPIDTPAEEVPTDTPVEEVPTDLPPEEPLPGAEP